MVLCRRRRSHGTVDRWWWMAGSNCVRSRTSYCISTDLWHSRRPPMHFYNSQTRPIVSDSLLQFTGW